MLPIHQILIIPIDNPVSTPQPSVYNAPKTVYETRKVLGLFFVIFRNYLDYFIVIRKLILIEVCISKGAMIFFR